MKKKLMAQTFFKMRHSVNIYQHKMDQGFVFVNDISATVDFHVDDFSRLQFLSDQFAYTFSTQTREFTLIDVRTGKHLPGLEKYIDNTVQEVMNLTSRDNFAQFKFSFTYYIKEQKLNFFDFNKCGLLARGQKIYLISTIAATKTKTAETTCLEFEYLNSALHPTQSYGIKYPINFTGCNSLYFERVYIGDAIYGIFIFNDSRKNHSHVINFARFEFYQIPAKLFFNNAKDGMCKCHPYELGYVEHTHKLLFQGKDAHYIFDTDTNKTHRVQHPANIEISTGIQYSYAIKNYFFILSSRILMFTDHCAVNSVDKTTLSFGIDTNDKEIIIKAFTEDGSTLYRTNIPNDGPNSSVFVPSFDVLKKILSDALAKNKKYVSMEYQITPHKYIDFCVTVDANYHKYTLHYVLHCIKHPFDIETEIKKLREEINFLKA